MLMMMVMMPDSLTRFNMAICIMTLLRAVFQFQCYMLDAMLFQLIPDSVFDTLTFFFADHVHSGIFVMPINAPYMDMENTKDALDFNNMVFV